MSAARYIKVWLHVGASSVAISDQEIVDNVNALLRERTVSRSSFNAIGIQIDTKGPPSEWQPPGGLDRAPNYRPGNRGAARRRR